MSSSHGFLLVLLYIRASNAVTFAFTMPRNRIRFINFYLLNPPFAVTFSSSFSFSLESCYNCPSSTRKRSIKTQIKLKNPSQTLRHTIEWRICGSIVPHLCDCISYLLLNLPFSTKHSIQRRICASIPNLVIFQEQILQLPHLPIFF